MLEVKWLRSSLIDFLCSKRSTPSTLTEKGPIQDLRLDIQSYKKTKIV